MTKQSTTHDFLMLIALSLGALLGALNLSLFNVALPTIMNDFNASLTAVQWLSSGYALATGIITPAAGYLSNRFGSTKLFVLICLAVILLSIGGSFASIIEVLILVRILFGLTAGLMLSLTLAMLYQFISPAMQSKSVGIWGMANMLGGILPACLSGLILNYFSWRALLWLNIPLALVALLLGIQYLPRKTTKTTVKLDTIGFALTALGSSALLVAFSNVSTWGWQSPQFIVAALGGFLLLSGYVLHAKGKEAPLLSLAPFAFKRYTAAFIIDFLTNVGLFLTTFTMPIYLQKSLGLSPLATGLLVLPGSIAMIIAMPLAGMFNEKLGERTFGLIGVSIIIVGSLFFTQLTPFTSLVFIASIMVFRSFGIGFTNLLSTNTQMSAVPKELTTHASSLTNWMRQIVGALVTSISSSFVSLQLAQYTQPSAEQTAEAYAHATSMLFTFVIIAMLVCYPLIFKYLRPKAKNN